MRIEEERVRLLREEEQRMAQFREQEEVFHLFAVYLVCTIFTNNQLVSAQTTAARRRNDREFTPRRRREAGFVT